MPAAPRVILHVDMDAFFAAVEQRDRPELRGRPVLVGGGRGGEGKRGVVTTASYEARAFGCRSAMPMAQARRLCPQAVVVPVRMAAYAQASRAVRAVLDRFTPHVQPVSIDEAYADVTDVRHLFGDGPAIARQIKRAIVEATGLTASVGVAPNKALAKLASDLHKPDGLTVIDADRAQAVLAPLPVRTLQGIGPAAERTLARLGVRRVGDLLTADARLLDQTLGRERADRLRQLARGEDDRPVHAGGQAKSRGHERTFSEDVADAGRLRAFIADAAERVAAELRGDGLVAARLTLKLRTPDFRTFTRSGPIRPPTNETTTLVAIATRLFEAWWKARPGPLRLTGVTAHELEPASPCGTTLFDAVEDRAAAAAAGWTATVAEAEAEAEAAGTQRAGPAGAACEAEGAKPEVSEARRRRVDAAADAIRAKFGSGAVRRGGSLG